MSETIFYSFSRPAHLHVLNTFQKNEPVHAKTYPYLLGMFFHNIGVLDKNHADFEEDAHILAEHIGFENAKDDAQNPIVYLKVNKTALEARHPDTLHRFQEGARDIPHLSLCGFSKEYLDRLAAIPVAWPTHKKSFVKRCVALVYRFLTE